MAKENKTQDKKIELKLKQIELPKVDVTKYIGQKVEIESADIYEGTYGPYMKVQTEIVETLGSGDKKIELRASKIIGLQADADGSWGYGEGTKMDLFLKKYKARQPQDLIGKTVILVTQPSKDNQTEFLTFN